MGFLLYFELGPSRSYIIADEGEKSTKQGYAIFDSQEDAEREASLHPLGLKGFQYHIEEIENA